MKSEENTNINSAESLHFEKITWDNLDAIINLHVTKEQRGFVASNINKSRLEWNRYYIQQPLKEAIPFRSINRPCERKNLPRQR